VCRRLSHIQEHLSRWHHSRSLPTHSTHFCVLHHVQADFSTSPRFLVVLWSRFHSTFLEESFCEVLQVNGTEVLRKTGPLSDFGGVTSFATLKALRGQGAGLGCPLDVQIYKILCLRNGESCRFGEFLLARLARDCHAALTNISCVVLYTRTVHTANRRHTKRPTRNAKQDEDRHEDY
jgi:hypothetical protein